MRPYYDENARGILGMAAEAAKNMGQITVGTEHILLALTKEKVGNVQKVLKKYGMDEQLVTAMIEEWIPTTGLTLVQTSWSYSPECTKVLDKSHKIAAWFESELTRAEHILLAILREERNPVMNFFKVAQAKPYLIYVDLISQMRQNKIGMARETSKGAVYKKTEPGSVWTRSDRYGKGRKVESADWKRYGAEKTFTVPLSMGKE